MAELLIKAIDAVHSNPVKDARGCYKSGDIVCVMPDGHIWGKKEGLPKFWIIKIPGVTVETMNQYVSQLLDVTGIVLRRRQYKIDTTKMIGSIRNQLQSTGALTITQIQFNNFVAKKLS